VISFQIEFGEVVDEQLQVKLLRVVKVEQVKHLKLDRMILPTEQLQKLPVQIKLVSMQLQAVAFSLLRAYTELLQVRHE
jgi:hypothetical protein